MLHQRDIILSYCQFPLLSLVDASSLQHSTKTSNLHTDQKLKISPKYKTLGKKVLGNYRPYIRQFHQRFLKFDEYLTSRSNTAFFTIDPQDLLNIDINVPNTISDMDERMLRDDDFMLRYLKVRSGFSTLVLDQQLKRTPTGEYIILTTFKNGVVCSKMFMTLDFVLQCMSKHPWSGLIQ